MSSGGFSRQLRRSLAASIFIPLVVVASVVTCAAYLLEIHTLSDRASYVATEISDVLSDHEPVPHDARKMLALVMSHLYHPGLTISVSNTTGTYSGQWQRQRGHEPKHFLIASDPHAAVPFARRQLTRSHRFAFYLARLVGYTGVSLVEGNTTVIIEADQSELVNAATLFVSTEILFILLSTGIAFAAAQHLSAQALAPLTTVLGALETFASGNLFPGSVETNRDDEIGRLAVAFNGAVETVSDALTKRDRAEEQLRQFLSDAAHQLQTPLTVLRGFIGILRRGELHSQEDLPRILATMDRQSSIMAGLVGKLMMLQDWESGAAVAHRVEISGLVDEIVLPIADANPERDLRLCRRDRAYAKVAPDELTYAVSNLVDNALKYAPDGSVEVNVIKQNGSVHIEVKDTGIGIKEDELARIFDRFYRGERRDISGSGLGLAIAKKAVERVSGRLNVASTFGEGSTFTIVLPEG